MTDQFDPSATDIRLRPTWGAYNKAIDAYVDLTWSPGAMRTDEATEKRLMAALGDGWEPRYRWRKPVQVLPYNAPNPSARARMISDMERRLTEAGVIGAGDVRAYPTGWLRIAEVMTHYMCLWAAEGEEIRIQQIKEKFGSLRCYVYGSHRLDELAEWCEVQSEDRCMATGRPGRTRNIGWVLCLSDEMCDLFQKDSEAVIARMYPGKS